MIAANSDMTMSLCGAPRGGRCANFADVPGWAGKRGAIWRAGVDLARLDGIAFPAKLTFLQRFRLFKNSTPSHDQLGIILVKLDPVAFQRCFVAWTAAHTKTSAEVIAIDGKTVRRSYQKKGAKEPIHVVSAFATRQRMVLGQTKVGDKSNEIVAIPALLDLLAIEGPVMTIDAMGCQREIAQTIIDKKADYILALKGNQGTLRDDVELIAHEQKAVAFAFRRKRRRERRLEEGEPPHQFSRVSGKTAGRPVRPKFIPL